jgi:VWFA-related protein
MPSITWPRAVLLAILIAVLGVPPGAMMTAFAQQGPGPEQPAPPQQPEQPSPPASQPPSPEQQKQAQPPSQPQVAIAVQTNLVNVDAVVTDDDGNIVSGLKRENFRILDQGQPQQITNFSPSDAPITIVMLVEFSSRAWGYFGYKAQEWAYGFLSHLNDKDWVALKTFDLKTTLQVDFTRNKNEVENAIATLGYTGFSESALFDSVLETLDQLRDVRGKKAILLIATGFDTISRHTLDETLRRVKETDTTIFCVGMGEEIDLYGRGNDIGYLQAKNQLTTFSNWTGGYAWFPRFQGEMPSIFNSVAAYLRSQYTLGFSPSTPQDGKYHKLHLDILDDKGNPLMLADKKGKMKKVIVYARQGYTAPSASAVN